MKNCRARYALSLVFVLAGLFWSASSHSVVFLIDEFAVNKNGANFFTDIFSNNLTPSQETSTYSVNGTFPGGAESGGQLTLNSDWGVFTTNAAGQPRQSLTTTLLSNSNPANPTSGLTKNSTMDVTGTFSLLTPAGPLTNGYGVRVIDAVPGQSSPDRLVELDIQYNSAFGGDVIRFLLQDFVTDTITTLGFVSLAPPVGADQIELRISRPDVGSNDFYGSYAFGTGGSLGVWTTFTTSGALFTNTDFVRAQFIAFTAVPEPGTLVLLGLGLAGLAVSRRRKQ